MGSLFIAYRNIPFRRYHLKTTSAPTNACVKDQDWSHAKNSHLRSQCQKYTLLISIVKIHSINVNNNNSCYFTPLLTSANEVTHN